MCDYCDQKKNDEDIICKKCEYNSNDDASLTEKSGHQIIVVAQIYPDN